MRISARGRYALAAVIQLAQEYDSGACVTVSSISESLGISKIYLEQVFALLKRGDIVSSLKGSQGGYMLARPPREISAYQVLHAVETALFQAAEPTVQQKAPQIDKALDTLVFQALDATVQTVLGGITLEDLTQEVERQNGEQGLMFFI